MNGGVYTSMNKRRFLVILVFVAIILMVISLFGIFGPKKEYLTTTGTIVNIVESMDVTTDSINSKAIIDYTADGKEYKNVEYGAYNSSMKIGDEVLVYYEPNDPTHIQAEGFQNVPYVVLGVSIVTIAISIVLFIKG